jgi:hypothetical protein
MLFVRREFIKSILGRCTGSICFRIRLDSPADDSVTSLARESFGWWNVLYETRSNYLSSTLGLRAENRVREEQQYDPGGYRDLSKHRH